ncbi:Uncharacterised protein [Mycobacteroides abscessus subsp. abscessus]|uniref:hypothetical protein n=1 Tax=Mycobacteroides abscessus TaxID=36809 RepID=UPI00092C73E5|nr:hypothetical protein [Mycobacteroides abscessus]SHY45855.1 Uncharacterised protein [Mycobacteroides abscessus subsp. abscessus]
MRDLTSLRLYANTMRQLTHTALLGTAELARFLTAYRPGDVPVVVLADEFEPGAAELRAGVDSGGLYIVNLIAAEAAWALGTLCMGRTAHEPAVSAMWESERG